MDGKVRGIKPRPMPKNYLGFNLAGLGPTTTEALSGPGGRLPMKWGWRDGNGKMRLKTFRAHTERIAFLSSVTAGLVIALAGVRVLSPLVDVESVFPEGGGVFPLTVFHSIDVILTAGLLGGGASGVHQIVKVFGDQMDSLRKK